MEMQSEKVISANDRTMREPVLLRVYVKEQRAKVVDFTRASDGDMLAKHHELVRDGWHVING